MNDGASERASERIDNGEALLESQVERESERARERRTKQQLLHVVYIYIYIYILVLSQAQFDPNTHLIHEIFPVRITSLGGIP